MARKRHVCVTIVYTDAARPGSPLSEQELCCDFPVGMKIPREFIKRLCKELTLMLREAERVIA